MIVRVLCGYFPGLAGFVSFDVCLFMVFIYGVLVLCSCCRLSLLCQASVNCIMCCS